VFAFAASWTAHAAPAKAPWEGKHMLVAFLFLFSSFANVANDDDLCRTELPWDGFFFCTISR
jgi:hypothetical protein